MRSPLEILFETMEHAGVLYCVLRDVERLKSLPTGGEIDILVHPADLRRVTALMAHTGFVPLVSWGHSPHHFFVHYDADADSWLKCDLVTAVAFGRPVHNLVTDFADHCLSRRLRTGACFAPCPEDELLTLLLHCVLDKQAFRPTHVARVKQLRWQVARGERLQPLLTRYWPGISWDRLAERIDREDWLWLLSERTRIASHLRRADRMSAIARAARDHALRKLHRAVGLLRPNAPAIALLAPDGAGKSTLVSGIRERYFAPVHTVYMGFQQRRSVHAAGRHRVPGIGLLGLLITQWGRYLGGRLHQARGQLVLFDRYSYDAYLPARGDPGPLRRARRWLLAHACPAPDLVVLLDAPGEVLFARKGEHSAAVLEAQRQAFLRLCARLGRASVVDATAGSSDVRRQVTALVCSELRRSSAMPPRGGARQCRGDRR